MTISVQALGALVAQSRRERGLSQAELAQRLGVSRKWLNELERGKPEAQLWRVLDVLDQLEINWSFESK